MDTRNEKNNEIDDNKEKDEACENTSKEDKEAKNNEIFKCIYDEIREYNYSEDKNLIQDYQNFIKFLDNKKSLEFNLKKEEIENIISINETIWNFLDCKVNAITINEDNEDIIIRYEITVFLENKEDTIKIDIIRTFFRDIYKYYYKNTLFICFTKESLRLKFNEISQDYTFSILQKNNGKTGHISTSVFFKSNVPEFTIELNYKFNDVSLSTIQYSDIYNIPKIIKGTHLNKKLALYIDLLEDDFNNFIYYETEARKKFLNNLLSLFEEKKYIGICGPFGTGKTITLLKFLIQSQFKKILYINLWTIENISLSELKILLNYESIKLFGLNFFNKKELEKCPKISQNTYKEVIGEIDKLSDKKNIFSLLESIIKKMNKVNYFLNIYIIIDQYSSKYDENNKSLKNLLKSIQSINNINIIVSSSMNNDDVKKFFAESLNRNYLFSTGNKSDSLGINYYYIGCLIRLNELNNLIDYNEFLKGKTPQFIKYLNKFGNLPLFYYELNKRLKGNGKLEIYIDIQKHNIIEEINSFYNDLNKNGESKYIDILKILSIIDKKEIYLIEELSEEILSLPIKFLEIKKETISINDLKLFAIVSDNRKLIDKFKEIEEDKDDSTFNSIIYYDKYLSNFMKFINDDNYCSNYIKPISLKKRKKILGQIESAKGNKKITIYYLDFLFPYMEEIFSHIIYKLTSTTSKFIFKNLSGQTKGGFLEYIINEHVKKNNKFMNCYIQNFETIECLVPNNFYIQNYSTRLKETIKTYIENKDIKNKLIIDLSNQTTFLQQNQFTGKYYDCCLLIYNPGSKTYILYVFQISKKKIAANRYYREEHKIILNRVKKNLEEKYSIKIDEAHFSYILLYEEQDKNTINFCDKYSLKYYLFSIEKLCFQNDNLIFDDKSLITKEFPVHSSFSILPKEKFKINSNGVIEKMEEIIKFEKEIKFTEISEEFKIRINQLFKPKDNKINSEENEFLIVGNFNKKIDVNNRFCFWFDNNQLLIIYRDKDNKEVNIKLDIANKLSNLNYTLICSKYKIKCIYNNC